MAVTHGSSKVLPSERRRQQTASVSRSVSTSRQQVKKQSSRLGFLRWLPYGVADVFSPSNSPVSSRKPTRTRNTAWPLVSSRYTPYKVSKRLFLSLTKLLEVKFSLVVFKLCLLVLTLTGIIWLFLLHVDSPKQFSLALSGPGLSPEFALPVRYVYISLTRVRDDSDYSSNSVRELTRLFSSWWQKSAASRFFREIAHEDSGVSAEEFSMRLDPAQWKVTWTLIPLPPASLVGKKLASFTVVDRGAGVYILRYRLLQSIPKGYTLEARLSHSGQCSSKIGNKNEIHASTAPVKIMPQTFKLKGPVYIPSSCPCPVKGSHAPWLQALQCPDIFAQLTEDLFPFRVIDLHYIREESRKLVGPQSLRSVIHYVVKDNQLYRRSLGPLPGFQYFSDAVFSYLTSVVQLPEREIIALSGTLHCLGALPLLSHTSATDVEFLFNLGDWPIEHRNPDAGGLPIFGWSGGTAYADIVLPQWEVLKGIFMLGHSDAKSDDLLSAQQDTSWPLKDRIPKAFFRGRDSNPIRVEVARLARKHPSLLDVRITSWEREEHTGAEKELGGGPRTRIPLQKFGDYKYQLLLDGTVAAYRTPYLLHSGSVPLKHESDYYEWFYSDLVPMEHYIPFQADLSDLIKQVQWAEEHPEETAAIAKNAQNYAREFLMPEKVVCYYYRALIAYALRQNTPPEVEDDMVKVDRGPRDAGCSCTSAEGGEQIGDSNFEDDYPIVSVYPDNVEEGVVLLTFSSFCNYSALYMPKFLKLARLYTEKEAPLLFAAADGHTYRFPSAYHFCNLPGAQPKVIFLRAREYGETRIANVVNTQKPVPEYMQAPLTLYDTANFVNKYLPQQFHVEVEKDPLDEMSQPVPTDNEEKLIKIVVGGNFDDVVLNNTKDVLLFLHAPWCGLCKRFKHVYKIFAEEVRHSPFADELLFTSMNGSENRLRYREFSWSSYPILWYVRGDGVAQRMRPTLFSGPWDFAGLKNFVYIQRKASEKG